MKVARDSWQFNRKKPIAGVIRHHARAKTVDELVDNGYEARWFGFWSESRPAHQRESANMTYAMKKREVSDKGRAEAAG